MVKRFRNLPIEKKLYGIVLLTSGLLVGLMACAGAVEKFFSFRAGTVADFTALARVIAANSTAALAFDDPHTADEVLSGLKEKQHLKIAILYDLEKEVFATYANPAFFPHGNPGDDHPLVAGLRKGLSTEKPYRFSNSTFDVSQPILLGDKVIGTLALCTDLRPQHRKMQLFILVVAGFCMALFGLGLFICSRLNKSIVEPIAEMSEAMKRVSRERNYELRVERRQDDELGLLMEGLNDMLREIQIRDENIEQHRDLLAGIVEDRTRELSEANRQLRKEMEERKEAQDQLAHAQKMEAIGTLAGGVAHDLNNILSGLVSYPDLLLLTLDRNSEMRKPLETIKASGTKAAAIVQDLLTLARRGVKIEEEVELNKLVSEYLESPECVELKRLHPKVRINYINPGEPVFILGSAVHLSKALMNLVSNAAEAMPDGGVVSIALSCCRLDRQPAGFSAWREGVYGHLSVLDTGVGIAREYQERIFEPFYSRKIMGRSGTGLGMAVVWGTIDDHRGYITLESQEGVGTLFDIYLPVLDVETIVKTVDEDSVPKWGKGEKVLVVDDMKEQRELAVGLLDHLGYSVTSVNSGEDALEYLSHRRVDLVILDMLMAPGIDGLETYKRILEILPEQRVIIVSGYARKEQVEESKRLGILDYVLKPYTLDKISAAVYGALHGDGRSDNRA